MTTHNGSLSIFGFGDIRDGGLSFHENENTECLYLWNTTKTFLVDKFITLSAGEK